MTHRPGSSAALLLAAATASATASACGSTAPSDKQQIASIVAHEGMHPATLCGHLTNGLLVRLGGKAGCLRQAASAAPDPTTRATSIRVRGRSATAVVVDRTATRTIRFVKHGGTWKVAGVG